MVNFCLILHRVSSKITIFVSLMYHGSALVYTQEVLVYTKSITRIKTKGGAILKINRDHKPPSGPYFLKGPSSPNVPYIQYVLALSLLLELYIIMFGNNCVFFRLSWVQPIMPIEVPWGQISVEKTWNPLLLYRMRTAIASSVKFLPCILKKIKCEYFPQSVPNLHPPPPPTSEQMGSP